MSSRSTCKSGVSSAAGKLSACHPKAYDVLVALVQQRGCLVTKDELLKRLWPGSFVEEGSLNVHVSALRKALGDDAHRPIHVETVVELYGCMRSRKR